MSMQGPPPHLGPDLPPGNVQDGFPIDVQVQIGLGRFFGQKLRAGVLYALFERTGNHSALAEAIKTYRAARQSWAGVAAVTSGVYVRDLTYGEGWFQRGHWSDRLAAIDQDLALMQQKATAPPPVAADLAPGRAAALIQEILGQPQRPAHNVTHVPPASFRRGQPVAVTLTMADAPSPPPAVLSFCSWLFQHQAPHSPTHQPTGIRHRPR